MALFQIAAGLVLPLTAHASDRCEALWAKKAVEQAVEAGCCAKLDVTRTADQNEFCRRAVLSRPLPPEAGEGALKAKMAERPSASLLKAAVRVDAGSAGALFDGGRARGSAEPVAAGTGARSPKAVLPPNGGAPPPPPMDRARREALVRTAKQVLEVNRQSIKLPTGEVRFTSPDLERYPYQWLWDSCFHALGLRHYDVPRAADELRSLLAAQWPNGMIPNMVHARADILGKRHREAALHDLARGHLGAAWGEAKRVVDLWRKKRELGRLHSPETWSSGITQPPIVAEAALDVSRKMPPQAAKAFLAELYPKLRAYYDWIGRERVQNGLMVIYHMWETGTDNSPRFDAVVGQEARDYDEHRYNHTKKWPAILALKKNDWKYSDRFAAKPVDMNAYYHRNLLALAAIARAIGKGAEAGPLEAEAASVRKAMLEQMWDPKTSIFRDLGRVNGRWTAMQPSTAFTFVPLYAGILDKGDPRAKALIDRLLDPKEFWTTYPVPTVAPTDPAFDPSAYWRGTSWVNINYFIIRGLLEQGRVPEARELICRTLEMVERGGMREFFNPKTAQGFRAKQFSWTAALVIELNDLLDRLPAP